MGVAGPAMPRGGKGFGQTRSLKNRTGSQGGGTPADAVKMQPLQQGCEGRLMLEASKTFASLSDSTEA